MQCARQFPRCIDMVELKDLYEELACGPSRKIDTVETKFRWIRYFYEANGFLLCQQFQNVVVVMCSPVSMTNRWEPADMFLFLSFVAWLCSISIAARSFNSSNSSFLLSNNLTDIRLNEAMTRTKMDCLSDLLELYYGNDRSACQNLAEMIVSGLCSGCPWSRLNAEEYASALGYGVAQHVGYCMVLFRAVQPLGCLVCNPWYSLLVKLCR